MGGEEDLLHLGTAPLVALEEGGRRHSGESEQREKDLREGEGLSGGN